MHTPIITVSNTYVGKLPNMSLITNKSLDNYFRVGLIIILALVCIVILTAAFHHFVTSRIAFGIDFYVYWLGGKALFLNQQSPYSSNVAQQAQLGIFGRISEPYQDQHMFLNPPYSLIPFLPSFWLDYTWAYAFFIALNFVLLAFALRFAFPTTPIWILASAFFFYPIVRSLIMGQLSLTIGILFLIAHGILIGKQGRQSVSIFFAGILLAWVTNKPQLTWLLVAFYLLYSLHNRLLAAVIGFAGGMALFGFLSWSWVPDWPFEMLKSGLSHAGGIPAKPWVFLAAEWFFPSPWSLITGAIVLAIAVSITIIIFLKWWRGEYCYLLMLTWVVVLSFFLNPLTLPPEQVIFLIPLLAWGSQQGVRSNKWFIYIWVFALVFPWILFLMTVGEAESFALSIWPPLLFILWSIWLLFHDKFRAPRNQ